MSGETLNFSDLPLIEVALKRIPRTHIPISLPFVLRIRDLLPARFDRVLDLDVLEQPPGDAPSAVYNAQITCGCRFVDSSLGVAVNLQPDMLVVRWMEAEGKPYPRFSELRRAAEEVTTAIAQIGLGSVETALVNMAYANRIEAKSDGKIIQPKPWPLSDPWTPVALKGTLHAFETQSVWRGQDEIDRRVLVQTRAEAPDAPPWYLLLTVAGKKLREGELLEEAENGVHGALIEWFPHLLSDEAKRAFGLQT